MIRWLPVLLLLWFCAPDVSAAQASIHSKADLTRYLRRTPAGASPLDPLSTGGRKRFLAQLKFGKHGLKGFSFDDPQNELTHPQIIQLFALFGVRDYAKGLGVTPARRAQLEHERATDAATSGCAFATCPESAIEQRYDELVLWTPDISMPEAKRAAHISRAYDRLFARYQRAANLQTVSPPDLRLLKRAAEHVVFVLPDTRHITPLRRDLVEMQRREMTDDHDYRGLYDALVANRQFTIAENLARRHPGMDVGPLPTLNRSGPLQDGWPTALTTSEQGAAMTRKAFDLSVPLRIVVIASCHFSQDAARAIEADPPLRTLFANHAIWLASENESFAAVIEWNQEFPDQPIHVAWRNNEWSMLDTWAMPTFYVFHKGQLTQKFSGWYNLKTLKQSLREAGAIR